MKRKKKEKGKKIRAEKNRREKKEGKRREKKGNEKKKEGNRRQDRVGKQMMKTTTTIGDSYATAILCNGERSLRCRKRGTNSQDG